MADPEPPVEPPVIPSPPGTLPSDMTCEELLKKLYDTIFFLSSGGQVSRVRFSEREVQYTQANLKDLTKLYEFYWDLCGLDSGLPGMVMRGRAMRFTNAP